MAEVRIDFEHCKGCTVCVDVCPRGVLVRAPRTNLRGVHPAQPQPGKECVGCGLCALVCPDLAITIVETGCGEGKRNEP
ncbi:MAG TPA: 4Fe-4S dicluster domain-containing protein [bacterium]|nr:4Fe-4S dicluster domain-containing protein [bacterium]HPJ71812.1 4Fe-4S dicluster domain-containing protein [bacterium]HPQ66395.1 4Fe-4S dicluster domain-containing protein [bacterium]